MPKVRKKSEGVLIMQIQMARTTSPTRRLTRLAATTALASLLPIMAMAQSSKDAAIEGCTLIDGRLPDDCSHLDAGTVVTMPVGENTEMETGRPKLNADGFAITIEAANPAVTARTGVASPASAESDARRMDRALADAGVIVSYFDGSPLRLPALPYYRGVARDRWVAIWPASAVIETQGEVLDGNF